MLVETIVYVQQYCTNGSCAATPVIKQQTVATQPVVVETKVKVRKSFRLFGGCKLFKGCR